MASCYERLNARQARSWLDFLPGMKISRAWQSLDYALFFELGALAPETILPQTGHAKESLEGEITVAIETPWELKKGNAAAVTQKSPPGLKEIELSPLAGRTITGFEIENGNFDLAISIEDDYGLTALIKDYEEPTWYILIRNLSFVELNPVWSGIDVTPCVGAEGTVLHIEYCYDESTASAEQLALIERLYLPEL